MRIALAQLNPTVGDLVGNARRAAEAHAQAKTLGADVIVFPELFLNGYPPEDLVLKLAFQDATRVELERLAARCADGPAILIGTIWRVNGKVYNAVALLDHGGIEAVTVKADLPNYGVFDEKRVFAAGPMPGPLNVRGVRIGVPICEDIWASEVVETLAETGAEIIISPNGSPFDWHKPDTRMNIAVARVTESGLPLAYLNQVGGQDELVFDGASFVLNGDCSLAVQLPAWREALVLTEWQRTPPGWTCKSGEVAKLIEGSAAAYHACVLGLRDYVDKNSFPGVVLGLSGGIDSALVAAIAVDALGPDRVHAVMLPSKFTSDESLEDAAQCANALGIRYDKVSIEPAVAGLAWGLKDLFAGTNADTTEENLQSRVRGTILMAISNKFGAMLVTTGNKSEMSVGYATLYGDMNGGFNPIKDLYKTEVYVLARWRNAHRPEGALGPQAVVIPERILTKAPTAELRANQTDQDSLPPYDELDDILVSLVEKEMPVADVIARGHAPETVKKVERLLYLAEYKRRQAAPGVKISSRNFGRDRRYPITNRFREDIPSEKLQSGADAPNEAVESPALSKNRKIAK
ncbi:NAD+ synthetase [Hyphomicrobium denitrificans 1NES1]|uniref:Glutamine-dependent NAD(+) synthetase n=1 Tax=Hyphomicrobium denitrificans 1NES1 TaxID=670307 RepID=N0B6M6_9HYPH|nr:NAD+ synthase [Hyphomicrobium denitrificans]AGK57882.1 NAD+ synthetase [Hyphomicrobium denitrificans 1NES1]